MRELHRTFDVARVASGLYLVAGFAGATLLVAGMLQIFEAWPWTLALIAFGGALTVGAWHRGRTILEIADPSASAVGNISDAPTPQARARRHRNRPAFSNPRVTEAR